MAQAAFVILAHSAAAVLLGWVYFRRYAITRPPVGVFNLRDIAVMVSAVVLIPFLYLLLPRPLVAGLLALGGASMLYFTWEPVLRSAWSVWLVTTLLAGADLVAGLAPGMDPTWFFATNNAVLVLTVVGVSNLWAQSGMKARDAAILGAALAIYDLIATSWLPLMNDLFTRLEGLPFTPMLAWPAGVDGHRLSIGLGDLLLAAVFPLVMRKAFGRSAGILAMLIGLCAISLLIWSVMFFLPGKAFPVMIVLGPLMLLQYSWQRKKERTTWQYLQAEPID